MTEGWRVVDLIDTACTISLKRGKFVVQLAESDSLTEITLKDTAVLMLGDGVQFAGGALRTIAEHDVLVLHCNWRGTPSAITTPTQNHSRVGARHVAQYNLSLPRKKNAWAQLVRAKVKGQAANLEGSAKQKLLAFAAQVRTGDPTNIEAQAAKIYWRALAGESNFRREARSRSDRNALLDYGYSIARGFCVRAVFAAGLSPTIGVFHSNRANAFALVDDIIEPFRPAIDHCVFSLSPNATLDDSETKRLIVASANQTFTKRGYAAPTEMRALAQRLGNFVEGNADRLEVNHWNGPVGD